MCSIHRESVERMVASCHGEMTEDECKKQKCKMEFDDGCLNFDDLNSAFNTGALTWQQCALHAGKRLNDLVDSCMFDY